MEQKVIPQGMTVGQLIEQLQMFNPEKVVGFSYNYQDHGRTQVVSIIRTLDTSPVKWSGYHEMFAIDHDEPEVENDDDEEQMIDSLSTDEMEVVVLS